MKKRRTIIIKNPLLRKVRNSLRGLFRLWASDLKIAISLSDAAASLEAREKLSDLDLIIRRSICYCRDCGNVDEDMVYVPELAEWICINCDSKREYFKKVKDEIRKEIGINMIVEFLDNLAGAQGIDFSRFGSKCEGYTYSRLLLSQMGIPKGLQDKFLELCHYYGGHCDCEIMLNAGSRLIKNLIEI
jgi:hypothetical protein